MPSLRDRLAAVSSLHSTRTATRNRIAQAERSAFPSHQPVNHSTVQLFSFDSHAWLRRLSSSDPRAAGILLRDTSLEIPPPSDWVFLDIETTGLSGGTGTYAFLIGVGQLVPPGAGQGPGGFRVEQFFLHDLAAERAVLAGLAERLADAPMVVTYNGKLFDLPVLETRFRLMRRRPPLAQAIHLDLLYPARTLWRLRAGSARLQDLERHVLGFERTGDVPGEMIPSLYFDYLRSGEAAPLKPVFDHNVRDIASLAALTAVALDAVAAPETNGRDALELLGLSRLYERAKLAPEARRLYERALAGGLPGELERSARRNLALLYKRTRTYERAAAHWRKLLDDQEDSLAAYEELAICYEHRLGDPAAALEVTRRALARLERLQVRPRPNAALLPASAGRGASQGDRLWRQQEAFLHRRERLYRKLGANSTQTLLSGSG